MLKRKIISFLILFMIIPAAVIIGYFLLKGKQYYIVSVVMILFSMVPFFLSLERKKLQPRELVITASIIAIAVASRAAFFFLPQVKPMCAVLIIAGVAYGAEYGFVCGALSMLISNFMYGQGMWTPFQMLAMGAAVFVAAAFIRLLKTENRIITGIVSGVVCFAVYGVIVDLSSVFMMVSDYNIKSVLSVYASGIPFNIIHGVTTAVCVALFMPSIKEKLERIRIKYGVFGEKR